MFINYDIIYPSRWWHYRIQISILCAIAGIALHTVGVFDYFSALDYHERFSYPYEGDISKYVDQLKRGETPDLAPINTHDYQYRIKLEDKCKDWNFDFRLLIVVKSALRNKEQREAIRQTWGRESNNVRRIFMLGIDPHDTQSVQEEYGTNGDLVQAEFIDSYFNNTIKTITSFGWVVKHCPTAQFVLFSDDDMYVSIKNVLKFVRDHKELYAGYVFPSSFPKRVICSKWHVSLSEYPYSRYPPYVTAAAITVTAHTLRDLYYTSFYTKHFRFDDVYIGLVAKKAGITPLHNKDFYFWKKPYTKEGYKDVIASHGFEPEELVKAWNEQRNMGNA